VDRLWSPWRYQYISKSADSSSCIFCDKVRGIADEENLILFRAEHNFVLLNLFPYTNGHLMIAPYHHVATLSELAAPAATEMMRLAQRAEALLRERYNAPGINLGMNIGACAGAGVAGHIHLHVLPRWPGDANFMTTVGETRVLPEDLSDTFAKLRHGW
jgi:ATP adenylyltransferase